MDSIATIGVLVVDESEAFLASTLHWIESRSDLHLVGTARNGIDALEAVDRLSPDLVIVDAVLKGIDGFRLARTLKLRENSPFVLLVTFHASAAARNEAFAAGADAFLAKYNFSDEVETILEKWKSERNGRTELVKAPPKPARRPSRPVVNPWQVTKGES